MAWSYFSPEHFVQAAESVAPLIYAERAATERNRALSSDLFGAIRDAGLFSLWVPKDFGGPEISIRDFMLVVEALARADASIGWCAANASTNSVLSGYLSGPNHSRDLGQRPDRGGRGTELEPSHSRGGTS